MSPDMARPLVPARRRRRGVAWRAMGAVLLVLTVPPAADPARAAGHESTPAVQLAPQTAEAWRLAWQQTILREARTRYCDTALGEELGWRVAPILGGFYYGYLATRDARWIERLVEWTDAVVKRGVVEPDNFVGWPTVGAAGTEVDALDSYDADSLLGEAKMLRPVVEMSALIGREPALKSRFGTKADGYLALAKSVFRKWVERGAWRRAGDGAISVVLPFGIDAGTRGWTAGYEHRTAADRAFSHPDNKANIVATWLLAMADATGDVVYRERAEQWFRLMKSRMPLEQDRYRIWAYWQPAGPWDYTASGVPKHWVGVHPNGGYYDIDVEAIVDAYQHGIVFDRDDIERLVKTAQAEQRPWPALAPFDATIRQRVEAALSPGSWSGLELVPWYLSIGRPAVSR